MKFLFFTAQSSTEIYLVIPDMSCNAYFTARKGKK